MESCSNSAFGLPYPTLPTTPALLSPAESCCPSHLELILFPCLSHTETWSRVAEAGSHNFLMGTWCSRVAEAGRHQSLVGMYCWCQSSFPRGSWAVTQNPFGSVLCPLSTGQGESNLCQPSDELKTQEVFILARKFLGYWDMM